MVSESSQVLSYAMPGSQPGRFRHVKSIFPFSGGLILGAVLAGFFLDLLPDFATGELWIGIFMMVVSTALAGVYALAVLLLVGCFSAPGLDKCRQAKSWIIGVALPLLATGVTSAVGIVVILFSPPHWFEKSLEGVILIVIALMALVAPFLLIQRRGVRPSASLVQPKVRFTWKNAAVILALILALLLVAEVLEWGAEKKYDRECQKVASWVKYSHPIPGAYVDLTLPPSSRCLSPDHQVDAVVLEDGRVLLILKTEIGFRHNWWGLIYSSGPILPSEIGMDAYNRPQIRIDGLPEHFIKNQADWQHFTAGCDLG